MARDKASSMGRAPGHTVPVDLSVGMSDAELERICGEDDVDRGHAPWIYWASEAYGFGTALREYARFPRCLPLAVCCDHSGPKFSDEPASYELNSRAPFFLSHTESRARRYAELTGRRTVLIASPAVLHRRRHGFERNDRVRGTIAFPTHLTPSQRMDFPLVEYVEALRALPDEFQPIAVCLHMHDIHSGVHQDYRSLGVPVVSAGHPHDRRFLDRFYSLMSSCIAATSDRPCTAMFLALEMDVPFFILGRSAEVFNLDAEGDVTGPGLPSSSVFQTFAKELAFAKIGTHDSAAMKILAERMLGMQAGISSKRLAWILWWSLFAWMADPVNMKDAFAYLVSGGRKRPERNR